MSKTAETGTDSYGSYHVLCKHNRTWGCSQQKKHCKPKRHDARTIVLQPQHIPETLQNNIQFLKQNGDVDC